MATFTAVYNGYDRGTAYYMDDKLHTWVHCNDEHEIEGILLGVLAEGKVTKVEAIDIDEMIDVMEEKHGWDWDFEYPESLTELKKMMEEAS